MSWFFKGGRLKDFAYVNARSLGASTSPDFELQYIEISNVDKNGVISEESIETIRFEDAPSRARRIVTNQSTIISSVRPNLQAMAYFEYADANLICSTGFNVVTPRFDYLLGKYLYYLLRSDDAYQYFVSRAKGVGYPAVDEEDFATLPVKFPVVGEQTKICNYLDKTFSVIDDVIRLKQLDKEKTVLEDYKKSIIHECVTGMRRITDADLKKVS